MANDSPTQRRAPASKGARTRLRIVDSAVPIFNRCGYDAAALSAVLAATGLKKGGLYRHFDSKEALAVAAFDEAWARAFEARRASLTDAPSVRFGLRSFVEHFVTTRVVPGGCPMFNAAVHSDRGSSRVRARARGALRQWTQGLSSFIDGGRSTGEVRPEVASMDVAVFVVSSLEGALVLSRLERSSAPLRRVQRQLAEYLEAAVFSAPRLEA